MEYWLWISGFAVLYVLSAVLLAKATQTIPIGTASSGEHSNLSTIGFAIGFVLMKEIQSATFPDCPIRNVISHITDKWSLLVLYTLEQKEVVRFKDLWRQIPDISQKMFTTATM